MLVIRFGDDVYKIVQNQCPNLTCCADCRIDDFCHIEGCEILEDAEEDLKNLDLIIAGSKVELPKF